MLACALFTVLLIPNFSPGVCAFHTQGYATGNGVADDVYDGNGQAEFAYNMGLLDPPTYVHLRDVCHGAFWNATPGGCCCLIPVT